MENIRQEKEMPTRHGAETAGESDMRRARIASVPARQVTQKREEDQSPLPKAG
jgi:hypothetical protein